MLLDIEGLRKFWVPKINYVLIALLGKSKKETGNILHLIPCVRKTGSRIEVFKAVERLIMEKNNLGKSHGPGISNKKGIISSPWSLNKLLYEELIGIFQESPHLFPPTI